MQLIRKRRPAALSLPTLRLEGGLFLPDQLEKAALGQASHQDEADYHTPKGLKLKDDYSRAFQIACAQWKHFAGLLERQDTDAAQATAGFVRELLRDTFGYPDPNPIDGIDLGERHYPVTLMAGSIPVVVAPHSLGLDDLDPRFAITGSGSRRKSAFQLAQEFLNASPDHLWAMASNGRQLRLLRDAATLTRPSYLEVDLQDLLGDRRFAEFAMVWRLLHASRAGAEDVHACIWETWREDGHEEGTRVRKGMRVGVTRALLTLGSGFLQHPANETLRRDLQQGRLDKEYYFQQLLRLVYRLIFLFTVEERGLLHPADDSAPAIKARRAYAEGYALARLRDRSLRRRARTRFDDLWTGLRIVFRGLAQGEPRLALPALGGLFAESQCPDLDAAGLSNAMLLETIADLRWDNSSGTLAPVDYRNMGSEELGSVYESLLELVPEVDIPARTFGFTGLTSEGSTQGNVRKTSGSYYTPDALVQELIKSALDPLIEQRLADNSTNPIETLLTIKVIDPACGSGHFLLAAARRLAEHLATLRAPDGAVKPPDYRHALREVISRCIFGVDRNPMALELCRTALWLEGFEEGRPLSFLDHHLQCGDALLGLTDLSALEIGIAPTAFKPLSGDDKATCKQLAKDNREGLKALEKRRTTRQHSLALEQGAGLSELQALEALPFDTPADIAAREAAYEDFLARARESRLAQAADLLVGAFLLQKTPETAERIPTSRTVYLELFSESRSPQHERQLAAARDACQQARVLHWPLAFPQVFKQGGFDCVLGNPPWERIKLQEEEFFATRSPLVTEARNKAERSQRIDWLSQGLLVRHLYPDQDYDDAACEAEQRLYREFLVARRTAEAVSVFAHVKGEEGGRFPLTGVGDVNTYALFAETISQVTAPQGRAGFIVPTGIATDDSTKAFFSMMVRTRRLAELLSFENEEFIFPDVHHSFRFCLLVLSGSGYSQDANFVFFARQPHQIHDSRRRFQLSPEDFARINPNTLTCPVFRSHMDAELTRKIYKQVPVLIREAQGRESEQNPWGISFMRMFDMSNDSHLFEDQPEDGRLPLYEAKMIHQFDHRWASYRVEDGADVADNVPLADKRNSDFTVTPRYWVVSEEVYLRIADLPKGLLDGLRKSDEKLIVLSLAHLMFSQWMLNHPDAALFPAWKDFVATHPFFRSLRPTSMGLCGNNAPSLVPVNDNYLPADPINEIVDTERNKTAWYAVDPDAVEAYLFFAERYRCVLPATESIRTAHEAIVLAHRCLVHSSPKWLLGWRDITSAHVLRTVIASVVPIAGIGNQMPLMFPGEQEDDRLYGALVGNLSTIALDFIARHKVGGTHLNYFIVKQIAVLPPDSYTETDLAFIVPRVLELTYTAWDLQPWAQDLGYDGEPFTFDPDRRAILRAELDAWYARAYGLTRDELRYVLDPADVMGEDYPSETFRVLKNNELREFGEYRTQRLVLEAWDKLERGELV